MAKIDENNLISNKLIILQELSRTLYPLFSHLISNKQDNQVEHVDFARALSVFVKYSLARSTQYYLLKWAKPLKSFVIGEGKICVFSQLIWLRFPYFLRKHALYPCLFLE